MTKRFLVLTLLFLAPTLDRGMAQSSIIDGVRRPRGIYAVVDIDSYIGLEQFRNPSITSAELHSFLNNLYNSLLANPSVSGFTIQVGWGRLNPNPLSSPQPYDWSWLDDAFSAAATWNAQNSSQVPKTIQVQVFPGYFTPQWVLDLIPSCDGLFMSPPKTPPSTCGEATFANFFEPHLNFSVLPLPWNPLYKSSYRTFLVAFAARYGSNPVFVSMDVGGPTAASTEMILPNSGNTPAQKQFGDILPGAMWQKLLALQYPGQPSYQNSDQAFIDEWNAAIDMFGEIFNGLTLIAWTGDGLFNFGTTGFTVPNAFAADCPTPEMDCAAETTILSHFVEPTVAASDTKATGEEGLGGRIPPPTGPGNLSPYTAKRLAQSTEQSTSPSTQILGGQQFGTGFAGDPVGEGCTVSFSYSSAKAAGCPIPSGCSDALCVPVACIPQACLAPGVTPADLASHSYTTFGQVPAVDLISPEQAAYNVLRNYFDGTPAASSFGGTPGTGLENFLQIYASDFLYATAHVNTLAPVVETDGTIVSMKAQDILTLASQKLLAIAEDGPVITAAANAFLPGAPIAPNTWVDIKGQNLAPVGFDRIWGLLDFVNNQLPTQLSGVSVTVNGKSAFVLYISPGQLIILTPPDALTGPVQVEVTNDGQTSAAFTVEAHL